MNNLEKITALYKLGVNKDEILNYVKASKITQDEYKTITGEVCPTLTLDELKNMKKLEIGNACQKAQLSGFYSSAYQGVDKLYSSDLMSQQFITGNATAAASQKAGVASCQNDTFLYKAEGENSYSNYAADEIATLAKDLKSFIEQNLLKQQTIFDKITTATTADQLNAISWDMNLTTA